MKQSPREQEQAKLFGPSKFSAEGFLGDDPRQPEEIIAADKTTVESLGTTCEAIAALIAAAFDRAEAALGDAVELKPGVTAAHFEARGKIPSPFRGDGVFQKGEVAVTEKKSATTIFITRLGINLIRKHGFFQGRGSRYRIEPEAAIRLCLQTVAEK
ncbi:MAG: hypothetical protein JW913_07460 [Chitinispirillaceae bacterium]|nr:hypothetical protein [Chitinispirillaceae bacterium]